MVNNQQYLIGTRFCSGVGQVTSASVPINIVCPCLWLEIDMSSALNLPRQVHAVTRLVAYVLRGSHPAPSLRFARSLPSSSWALPSESSLFTVSRRLLRQRLTQLHDTDCQYQDETRSIGLRPWPATAGVGREFSGLRKRRGMDTVCIYAGSLLTLMASSVLLSQQPCPAMWHIPTPHPTFRPTISGQIDKLRCILDAS